jgi:GNAT superfamily N-acetyltransferase
MSEFEREAEAVERAALADLHAAADGALRRALGLRTEEVGTALVSVAAALPPSAIVVNRAIGLGVAAPASREGAERVVRLYRDAGVRRFFVHLQPEARPPELRAWLEAAGLERARGWAKFERGREAPPDAPTDLEVRRAEPEHAQAFGRIVADAFDLGEAAAPWLARLVGRRGWHVYMTFDGDTPAGTGCLFVHDGLAWLDWDATAPAFRRRGGQTALLRRRILDALDLGCRRLAVATGEEVPGDPQHSYKNIVRVGFRPTHVRENYAPPRR